MYVTLTPINKHFFYYAARAKLCERFERESSIFFFIFNNHNQGQRRQLRAATEQRTERRSLIADRRAEPSGRSSIVDALIVVF